MRRAQRNNQGQQLVDKDDDSPKIPAYERVRRSVIDVIEESGDYGMTAGDLYESCSEIDARRIREAVQSLKGREEIFGEKCRCGCATIYRLKKYDR